MPANDVIQFRRGTAAAWTAANPVLGAGEPGYETDTKQEKLGDGITAYTALPYIAKAGSDNLVGTPGLGGTALTARVIGASSHYDLGSDAHANVAIGSAYTTITGAAQRNVSYGLGALGSLYGGVYNVAIGTSALGALQTDSNNIAIGDSAAATATTVSAGFRTNIALGYHSMMNATGGDRNIAIGNSSLLALTGNLFSMVAFTGTTNGTINVTSVSSFTGLYVGQIVNANDILGQTTIATLNPGGGSLTLSQASTGAGSGGETIFAFGPGVFNTAVGDSAGMSMTIGWSNCFFGSAAAQYFVAGQHNIALGESALAGNNTTPVTCNSVIAIGTDACLLTSADFTIGIGASAAARSSGANVIGIGQGAASNNTTGHDVIAIGNSALVNNTTAPNSIAIGTNALAGQTAGSVGGNIAIGPSALTAATTATNCIAIGASAMNTAAANSSNSTIAIGASAGHGGTDCISIGTQAGAAATANQNIAIGTDALHQVVGGAGNMGIGYYAGYNITSGSFNLALGNAAGYTDGTSTTNAGLTNATMLGYQAQAQVSNVIVLGSAVAANRPNLMFGGIATSTIFESGAGVMYIANAATNPTPAAVSGGVILYSNGGHLYGIGTSGTAVEIF